MFWKAGKADITQRLLGLSGYEWLIACLNSFGLICDALLWSPSWLSHLAIESQLNEAYWRCYNLASVRLHTIACGRNQNKDVSRAWQFSSANVREISHVLLQIFSFASLTPLVTSIRTERVACVLSYLLLQCLFQFLLLSHRAIFSEGCEDYWSMIFSW